jgi:hypothetical protein
VSNCMYERKLLLNENHISCEFFLTWWIFLWWQGCRHSLTKHVYAIIFKKSNNHSIQSIITYFFAKKVVTWFTRFGNYDFIKWNLMCSLQFQKTLDWIAWFWIKTELKETFRRPSYWDYVSLTPPLYYTNVNLTCIGIPP